MDKIERQACLQNIVMLLQDNAANRITLALVNGISVTHGQFLDSLLVAEQPVDAKNNGVSRKRQKE